MLVLEAEGRSAERVVKVPSDVSAGARWRAVWLDFKQRIETGVLKPGEPLPSLAELSAENGISFHAARQVMARLRRAGLVVSWHGVGHCVAQPNIEYKINKRTRFALNVERVGHQASTEPIGRRYIRADAQLANDLGVRLGTLVLLVELLRKVDGRPTMIGRHHFEASRFERIDEPLAARGSVTHALAEYGVKDFLRTKTLIASRLPTGHEALLLGIPMRQPVVVATGINVQSDGSVVEVSSSISRGDCVRFRV